MNTLILALILATPGATLPPTPPVLFTYGDMRVASDAVPFWSVASRLELHWERAELQATAFYNVGESNEAKQAQSNVSIVEIPRVSGKLYISYNGLNWTQPL